MAAWALWRITGELGSVVTILTNAIVGNGFAAARMAPMLESLGPAALIAAPYLRALLEENEPGYELAGIARALWAITGDPAGLISPLLAAIEKRPFDGEWPGEPVQELQAIEVLGSIGPAAAEAVPILESIANGAERVTPDDVWLDERCQRAARTALSCILRS